MSESSSLTPGALDGTRRGAARSSGMTSDKVYDEPTKVDAEDGNVVLDGPDGVAVLMTPEAAEETSHRLLWGAAEAQGQRVQKDSRNLPGTEKLDVGSEGAAPP